MNIKINDTKKTNKVNIRIEIAGLQKFSRNYICLFDYLFISS